MVRSETMNQNKQVKFRHETHKGIFLYEVYDGAFVVLSKIDSGKIDYIKKHGSIDITFDIEEEIYDVLSVDVIEDPDYVQKVYDFMIEKDNAYFTDGTEGLCVLRFHK